MKIYLVLKIARQYEGELLFINVLKAFNNKEKAQYWVLSNRFPQSETIDGVECLVEIGIIEDVEVEL